MSDIKAQDMSRIRRLAVVAQDLELFTYTHLPNMSGMRALEQLDIILVDEFMHWGGSIFETLEDMFRQWFGTGWVLPKTRVIDKKTGSR